MLGQISTCASYNGVSGFGDLASRQKAGLCELFERRRQMSAPRGRVEERGRVVQGQWRSLTLIQRVSGGL